MSEAITPANESADTERVGPISQVSGHQHVLVACGDSFVGPLKLLNRGRVLVKRFSGASAKVGLGNKNSVSQTGVLVTELLDTHKPEQVLFVFGQVDLHILYLWKALKAQRDGNDPPSPDDWRATVLNAYTTFLRNDILTRRLTENSGYLRKIFVSAVIVPCVKDENLDESVRKYQRREGDVAQTRDLRLADCKVPTDIQTRRAMIQDFNMALSSFCEENGVRFVDINKYITTADGEVKPEVLDHDPTTIHVQWESTIGYWVEELAEAGLTRDDIHVDLHDSAAQYEAEKKGRMQRRKATAADATFSPTLSDYSVMSEDPGSPLLLPRPLVTWTRGRSSTPPPMAHARSAQTSPEHTPSWRGRVDLGRGRGSTGSPPRGPKPSRFHFGGSPRSRADKDENWRSRPRGGSVTHVPSADLPGVFQSANSSPVLTPLQSPLFGEFSRSNEPAVQEEELTQVPEQPKKTD